MIGVCFSHKVQLLCASVVGFCNAWLNHLYCYGWIDLLPSTAAEPTRGERNILGFIGLSPVDTSRLQDGAAALSAANQMFCEESREFS